MDFSTIVDLKNEWQAKNYWEYDNLIAAKCQITSTKQRKWINVIILKDSRRVLLLKTGNIFYLKPLDFLEGIFKVTFTKKSILTLEYLGTMENIEAIFNKNYKEKLSRTEIKKLQELSRYEDILKKIYQYDYWDEGFKEAYSIVKKYGSIDMKHRLIELEKMKKENKLYKK
jgi:hypothetical protein